jgi:tripartite-type tricarboxylate transporter receptor subunit TctC
MTMHYLTRRRLLQGSSGLALLPTAIRAQTWPERPLRFVVPAAPGAGILDIIARLLAQHLSPRLGQQVVVDNKPGAGNNLGAEYVAKAPADGYTLLMCNSSLTVADYLYARLGYKPMSDLLPVTQVNSAPLMMVLHPSVKANSVQEVIAYAKANPGKLNYGSGGIGSTPFLATELFKSMTGTDIVHVPYKGGAPALADLVAGQIALMIENVPGTMPFVKDGKLRALAISSRKRSALAPELPTMDEAGVHGYDMIGWNGVYVASGTPPAIVDKLYGELARIIATAELKDQLARLGAEPVGSPPAAFAAFMKSENERWGGIIRDRGIRPE